MLIDVEDTANNWQCQLPPEEECKETKLTVIFMAHNPDCLGKLLTQVKKFLFDEKWKTLIAEVVLTWRPVEESKGGQPKRWFSSSFGFGCFTSMRNDPCCRQSFLFLSYSMDISLANREDVEQVEFRQVPNLDL